MTTRAELQALMALCAGLDAALEQLQTLTEREAALERELNRVRVDRNAAETAVLVATELLKATREVAAAIPAASGETIGRPDLRLVPLPGVGTLVCSECQVPFVPRSRTGLRGGSAQLTCGDECRWARRTRLEKASHARRREQRRA